MASLKSREDSSQEGKSSENCDILTSQIRTYCLLNLLKKKSLRNFNKLGGVEVILVGG